MSSVFILVFILGVFSEDVVFGEEEIGVELGLFDEGIDGLFRGAIGRGSEGFDLMHDGLFEVVFFSGGKEFLGLSFGGCVLLHLLNMRG